MRREVGPARVWTQVGTDGVLRVAVGDGAQYDEYCRRGSGVAGGTHAILRSRADVEALVSALQEALSEMPE